MKMIFVYFALFVYLSSAARAQEIQTRISKDTIRVGDPFRALVRIELPPGTDIVLPDSLTPTDDVENAGKVRMRRDSAGGVVTIAAAYPLTAWRTGPLELPVLSVTVRTPNGRQQRAITLPSVNVISVLPADTTGIKAKPPKDVLGPDRLWWPWIVAALVLLALLALAYWWWRRRARNRSDDVIIPTIMPRDRALEEIERIRKLGLIEQKEFKRYYTLVGEVLRQYMQTIEPAWGTHLTTEELHARASAQASAAMTVLRQADLVKFARGIPAPETAQGDLDRTRAFIESYPPPPAPAAPEERVA